MLIYTSIINVVWILSNLYALPKLAKDKLMAAGRSLTSLQRNVHGSLNEHLLGFVKMSTHFWVLSPYTGLTKQTKQVH
jgi:hypothetical protein